jgi:DNA invertase Pin-like site-specific DNA recombinase
MPITVAPLVPKSPSSELNVVAIGRISTVHQDLENIEASYRYVEEYLRRLYQGPMRIKHLGEQASGMLTERATIREAEDLVATGEVDLVIAEDLARIYRNPRHQYNFVQDCVDTGTRVICVGDNLDTADENWEITMGAAALRHGLHIPDTRRRVRRTATHCFHNGGMVQKIRYGYRKLSPEEAASGAFGPKGLRIAKRPECTPVIRAIRDRVLGGERFAAIAEWLDSEGIEPGPYVERRRWSARLIVELLEDPILSGTRTFRDTICRPIFKTGKHKPTKNAEPERESCPELAHLSIEEHETLRQEIARRRAELGSKRQRTSPRRNTPRSRSIWPGQAIRCGVCGELMYYAGAHFKCKNALRGGACWNHVQVPAETARRKVIAWLVEHLEQVPEAREAMVDLVWQERERSTRRTHRDPEDWGRQIASLERQAANLTSGIAEGGQLASLVERLASVEAALTKARASREALRAGEASCPLPTRQGIQRTLGPQLLSLAEQSLSFAEVFRRLFPALVIHPVQLLDSGLVRPRARLVFLTQAIRSSVGPRPEVPPDADGVEVVLDLFEPSLPIRYLKPCCQARQEHPAFSLKGLARIVGIGCMTVKRALDYARLMEQEGLTEPYRELHERPVAASRWKRRRATG